MLVDSEPKPVFAAEEIWKAFPGVQALRGATFRGYAGRILGLVGENGAGKSTLMRIVAGVYQPDAGRLLVGDREVSHVSPTAAQAAGISMVHQDTRLAPDLDAAHNVWLGHEPAGVGGTIDDRRLYDGTRRLLEAFDLPVDLHTPVRELTAAQRQAIEIAKALSQNPSVLILDEPTSALDVREVEVLFGVLRELRAAGVGVVFVSHRLPEVLAITDSVTVMKDGEVVGTVPTADASEAALVRMMVGRPVDVVFPDRAATPGEPVLEIKGLSGGDAFEDVSFTVRRGEILGLGGVEGNGQRPLARSLFGLHEITAGSVRLAGRDIRIGSPREAMAAGIAYVSNDRRGESLTLPLAVRDNLALPTLGSRATGGVVLEDRESAAVSSVVREYRIRTPSIETAIEGLSGGNQQKVAVGRWSLASLKVVVLDEPTQGVDVGSKLELYDRIRKLADSGVAVVVLSSDLIELIGLSDRIVVLSGGRVVREVAASEATEETIVGAAVTARRDRPRAAHQRVARTVPRRRAHLASSWRTPLLLLAALVLGSLFATLRSPYFLTTDNLGNLAMAAAPLALVAIGQTLVMLLAGIDLSVGSLMSLTVALASVLVSQDSPLPVPLGAVACLLLGAAVGASNGLLIRFTRLPDLVVTLSTLFMVNGLALIVRPYPAGTVDPGFAAFMTFSIGPVPLIALVTFVAFIGLELGLRRTRAGVALYATGSSREAAFASGIDVDRVRFLAYTVSGLTAAVAGLLLAARLGSGDPSAGSSFTLASITAVVVGGVSVFGGRGTLIGALIGAVIVVAIQNVLNLLHVSAYYQYIWIGLLTLVGVAAYSVDWSAVGRRLPARRRAAQGGAS